MRGKEINIDNLLIKKSIPIYLPEPFCLKAFLRFPRYESIKDPNSDVQSIEFHHPIEIHKVGSDYDSSYWGKLVCFRGLNNIPDLRIGALTIDVLSEQYLDANKIKLLENYLGNAVDRAVSVIMLKDESCVFVNKNVSEYANVSNVETAYRQENGIIFAGAIKLYVDLKNDKIDHNLLYELCRNAGNELSIQYQMLSEIKEYLSKDDYRSCILHASTIVETTLLQQVDAYIGSFSSNVISDFVHQKISGYHSYDFFYKHNIIQKYNDKNINETMKIRNKVIHEGLKPTREQAKTAYNAIFGFLDFYKIPIFTNI